MSGPPRAALERELERIQGDLLRLGERLDQAIERSIAALTRHDLDLARQIVEDDAGINALRYSLEEACLRLIATQQPAAGDLRMVVAALSIVSDIERMADHAAGIARTVLRSDEPPRTPPPQELARMAELCRSMTRQALQAFVARDAEAARAIALRDDAIDDLYTRAFQTLLARMVEDPHSSKEPLRLLFAAHNLERIGDRATNIAERVVFLASGELTELNPEPDAPADLQQAARHGLADSASPRRVNRTGL